MNEELIKLINECNVVEFKVAECDGLYNTISAFANTNGGCIIVGVEDKTKEIKGINLADGKQTSISNKIVHSLGIQPDIQLHNIDGKNILKIVVEKSSNPVQHKGVYYKRVGDSTRITSQEELRKLLLKDASWDALKNNFTIDDIDEETVRHFVRLATAENKNRISDEAVTYSVEELLIHLDLLIDGKLTNAALLLFGKNPQKLFKKATVRIGLFKGNSEDLIIGDKTITGNLFKQFEEAETAIKSFINVKYDIKGFVRDEIWDYPLVAIREALLNALIHKDYFDNNSEIQIKIFDDHIWFYNSGDLYGGLTIEDLKALHHPSRPRNALLMDIIYKSGYVEQFGTGIKRMRNACLKQGLPVPEFELKNSGFVLQIDKDYKNINERQRNAIKYIVENESITNIKYQELNSCSREMSKRDLKKLVDMNILKTTGDNRALKYSFNL